MLTYFPELDEFREEIRRFVADKVPAEYIRKTRHADTFLEPDEQKHYLRLLFEQGGWTCPSWPTEYGGPGWSYEQQYVFDQEIAACEAPRMNVVGAGMLGNAVIAFGNDDQKQRFLPPVLHGDVIWCQGYSEPGSGSDLASLQCKAVLDGDDYVINGTKIWTTDGHYADWMFGLFRSNNSGKKQFGITVLLLDMQTPGIEVQPIITFDGTHEVNQVFFNNVRVPVANRLGEHDNGWGVAKHILGNERFGTAEVHRSLANLARLKKFARSSVNGAEPLINQEAFANEIAEVEIALMALETTEQRFLFGEGGPDAMGPEASILKIRGTEITMMLSELLVEALAYYAVPHVPEQEEEGFNGIPVGTEQTGFAARAYFNNRKTAIYSGSNEIMKNIISKAVLGL
tara:strand:- start:265 stop:1464 length:1200 start_codon:yes stop_codon:yes gene_type:complete